MRKHAACLSLLLATLVAGCSNESASYLVGGDRDNAFSLFRKQDFPGRDWTVEVVLTHMPECQRRYPLAPSPGGEAYKASLHRDADGLYALHAGDVWYQGRLEGCRLQKAASAPANPGELVGTWEDRDARLKFYPAGK